MGGKGVVKYKEKKQIIKTQRYTFYYDSTPSLFFNGVRKRIWLFSKFPNKLSLQREIS